MTYFVVGFAAIVLALMIIAVIASVTDTNMVDLMFGAFLFIMITMTIIGCSIEVGKLILG